MDGADVFSFAYSNIPKSMKSLIEYYKINIDDINYFVMHQANKFLCERIRKKMKIPVEKTPYSFMEYGNTSGGSIPLTMILKLKEQLAKENLNLLMTTIGGGFSIASARIKSKEIFCSDLQTL